MSKSIAITSVSAVGLGIVALGAAPAHAADVTTPCADATEHEYTVGALHDNWFMDCVPQYGAGKAEFSLSSTETLPPDFLPLDDPGVTSSSSYGAGAAAYFGVTGEPSGFADLDQDSGILDYEGTAIFPIAGVSSIPSGDLPAACDPATYSFANAYRVDYAPVTTGFSQTTSDGATWSAALSFTPDPAYLGFNFAAAQDGSLDPTQPQCLAAGSSVILEPAGDPFFLNIIHSWARYNPPTTMPPQIMNITPTELGDFPLVRSAPPGLADTGAELSPLVVAGGASTFLLGVTLLVAAGRSRAKRESSA